MNFSTAYTERLKALPLISHKRNNMSALWGSIEWFNLCNLW